MKHTRKADIEKNRQQRKKEIDVINQLCLINEKLLTDLKIPSKLRHSHQQETMDALRKQCPGGVSV